MLAGKQASKQAFFIEFHDYAHYTDANHVLIVPKLWVDNSALTSQGTLFLLGHQVHPRLRNIRRLLQDHSIVASPNSTLLWQPKELGLEEHEHPA